MRHSRTSTVPVGRFVRGLCEVVTTAAVGFWCISNVLPSQVITPGKQYRFTDQVVFSVQNSFGRLQNVQFFRADQPRERGQGVLTTPYGALGKTRLTTHRASVSNDGRTSVIFLR
jgi:hypothetical protein